MKHYFLGAFLLLLMNSCVPPRLLCFLELTNFEKTYDFDFSKEELKNQIVEAYTYDKSLLIKNLGSTLIENKEINAQYRKSVDIWLNKNNWDKVKSEIRNNTADTLYLEIRKHHSRKSINLMAIIKGNDKKSSLTIKDIKYRQRKACKKEQEYYRMKISDKIEKKLIEQLN